MAKRKSTIGLGEMGVMAALVAVLSFTVIWLGNNYSLGAEAAISDVKISAQEKTIGVKIQYIRLNKGWNLISLNVTPASYEVSAVFSALVKNNTLEIVKNNDGQVFWPAYKIDQIGLMSAEEGYWVDVKSDTVLAIKGMPVVLPFNIGLEAGWNTISYPAQTSKDGLAVVQQLINKGVLGLVQDIDGKKIDNETGVWINEIGLMRPGSGYQIYMLKSAVLVIE